MGEWADYWGEEQPTIPIAQVEALIRLLYPEHMTPIAKRQFEQVIEQHSKPVKPTAVGPACRDCGHPSAQHDDGGCMFPKWTNTGGTKCGCAGFEEG